MVLESEANGNRDSWMDDQYGGSFRLGGRFFCGEWIQLLCFQFVNNTIIFSSTGETKLTVLQMKSKTQS